MGKCIISIIIPVYNTSQWLESCLDSVTGQNMKEIEIICVDDGSTDNSSDILNRYAGQDTRIRILTHIANQGTLIARKTGIMAARGEYIMFVDSDDTIDMGLCSTVYNLIRDRRTDILEFSVKRTDIVTGKELFINPIEINLPKENILLNLFNKKNFRPSLCFRIFKSSICKKAKVFLPDFRCKSGEDAMSLFCIAFFASSYTVAQTESKYNYFYGRGLCSDSNMTLDKFSQFCQMDQIYGLLSTFLQQMNGDEKAWEALNNLKINLISNCCLYFLRVAEEDRAEAMTIFTDHWGDDPELPEGMMNRCVKLFNVKKLEMYQLKKRQKNDIQKMKDAQSEKIQKLQNSYDQKIEALNAKHQSNIFDLKEKHKTRISDLIAQQNNAIAEKDSELHTIKSENRKKIRALSDQIKAQNKKIDFQQREIELIYGSSSYKVGNLLIRPFHWVRSFFNSFHKHHK